MIVAPGERPSVSEGRTGVSRRTNDTRIFSDEKFPTNIAYRYLSSGYRWPADAIDHVK